MVGRDVADDDVAVDEPGGGHLVGLGLGGGVLGHLLAGDRLRLLPVTRRIQGPGDAVVASDAALGGSKLDDAALGHLDLDRVPGRDPQLTADLHGERDLPLGTHAGVEDTSLHGCTSLNMYNHRYYSCTP